MTVVAILCALLAVAGSAYTVLAARAVRRFARIAPVSPVTPEAVTLLKPLHGPEPRLRENLRTFLDQGWDAPIEFVAGVQRGDDPARAVAEGLAGANGRIRVVVDASRHGANAKIGNLINMMPRASHDLLVLSDSDMAVPSDYLARVAGALDRPGVGAVTCVYRGRGDAGLWSVAAAAGISYQFLPSVLLGIAFGLSPPCMGSTIALRRGTLKAIGGFDRFADVLADDNAIGQAVQDVGLHTALAPIVVTHACAERSLGALVRHELRWSATIRAISRWSHLGLIVTFPVGWAIGALALAPRIGGPVLAIAVLARLWLLARVDRLTVIRTAPRWMLLPRDMLSFAIYLASFLIGTVEWRGSRLRMEGEGRIAVPARP